PSHSSSSPSFAPNFDIHETPSAYILEGELPGLADKKAVNIEFTDGQTVVIAGRIERDMPSSSNNKEPKVWVSERSVGSFRRVFQFPMQVDMDGVKAGLENGILSMVVPKK
ncbi:HSP20-like chaperone, partial [Wilcoxina mikolae CBS 423.85]